jgi:hypothetical protein
MLASVFPSHVRSVTRELFLVLLFVVVCLPTGAILGVNVKFIVFGLFLVPFILFLATHRNTLSRSDVFFLLGVVAFLCFWSLIGVLIGQADNAQIFHQLRDLGSAILIAWLSIFSIRKGLLRPERLTTAIVFGMFAMSAMKFVLVAGSLYFDFSPVQIIESVFGEASTVAGSIDFNLVRLQFPADILGSFVLFALLAPSISGVKFGRVQTFVICIVVGLGSGFLAYSRYVWFIYIVSIFMAMIIERSWKVMTVTILTVLILCVPFYDEFQTIFEARFLSEGTEVSDAGRVAQAQALLDEVKTRPILGKGIGAHSAAYLSSDTLKYSYEMQWLSLLMQFGIVGEIGILLLVAASARDLVMAKHPAKLWLLFLFALWLLASWTNPYMTSSFAGATFGLFEALFHRMRNIATIAVSPPATWTPSQQPI